MKTAAWVCMLSLLAAPVRAQRLEIAPGTLVGFANSADIEDTAQGVSQLKIDGGVTWAGSVGYLFTSHVGVEARWMHHATGLTIEAPSSPSTTLFFLTTNELAGDFVYRFQLKERRLQPFMFGGLGITVLSASDLETEQKTTWNLGGGVTWFAFEHAGIRIDGRYNSIGLASSTSVYCAPLSFCQDQLTSIQWTAGLMLRF
jgi:hypothetical protein